MYYVHNPMSHTPFRFMYQRRIPTGGNQRTVWASFVRAEKQSLDGVVGACSRAVFDMGEMDGNYVNVDTGNSGYPWSPNYDDQMKMNHEGNIM